MLQLQDFINLNNNKFLDFDGAYGAQCVDLVQFWAQNLGLPKFHGNAIDLALQGSPNCPFISNTANNPSPGDIMIWGAAPSDPYLQTGPNGHTAIYVSGDTNSFNSFDQNFPTGSTCHIYHHHNYNAVVGWLHPLTSGGDTMLDEQDIEYLYGLSFHRDAKLDPGHLGYVGKPLKEVEKAFNDSPEHQQVEHAYLVELPSLRDQVAHTQDRINNAVTTATEPLNKQIKDLTDNPKVVEKEVIKNVYLDGTTTLTGWDLIVKGINKLLQR